MTPTSIRRLFWGFTVFMAGIVLLLQAVEILPGAAWRFIWPTFIVIIGLELILMSIYQYGEEIEIEVPKFFLKKAKRKGRRGGSR